MFARAEAEGHWHSKRPRHSGGWIRNLGAIPVDLDSDRSRRGASCDLSGPGSGLEADIDHVRPLPTNDCRPITDRRGVRTQEEVAVVDRLQVVSDSRSGGLLAIASKVRTKHLAYASGMAGATRAGGGIRARKAKLVRYFGVSAIGM